MPVWYFFEKLDQFRSRRAIQPVMDILEVYLLCLLLGFEGRYSGTRRGELGRHNRQPANAD
jgi:type VI protein secretion system component VasF